MMFAKKKVWLKRVFTFSLFTFPFPFALAVTLTEGPLADAREKGLKAFCERIDPAVHEKGIAQRGEVNGGDNALQEFVGHYLDLCATFVELDGSETARTFGARIVKAAAANVSADGYLGGEVDGRLFGGFSIWNQAHVVYGLVRYAQATGDPQAADLARKTGGWLLKAVEARPAADMVDVKAVYNRGSQELVAFYALGFLADLTGDRRALDVACAKLRELEKTPMNLISAPDCLSLQSRKGIEMMNGYRGVLGLGRRTGDAALCASAVRYWQSVADTQIRNTGGAGGGPGAELESFLKDGNVPRILETKDRPNENCIQCGWLRFTRECFGVMKAARCGDEMERTLFNLVLGSYANDGSDFSYYQGNVGKKVLRKNAFYECCRYRGFAILAHLPELILDDDGKFVTPLVYTPLSYRAKDGFALTVKTAYPADGVIRFVADGGANGRTLRLRVPGWCEGQVKVTGGEKVEVEGGGERKGFIFVTVPKGVRKEFAMTLEMTLRRIPCAIDGKPYAEYRFGPLVLVRDTYYGDRLGEPLAADLAFRRVPADPFTFVRFEAMDKDGKRHTLVDYAAAGRHAPNDEYETFIRGDGCR